MRHDVHCSLTCPRVSFRAAATWLGLEVLGELPLYRARVVNGPGVAEVEGVAEIRELPALGGKSAELRFSAANAGVIFKRSTSTAE